MLPQIVLPDDNSVSDLSILLRPDHSLWSNVGFAQAIDANSRRRRPRSHLLQAALWAPTVGEKLHVRRADGAPRLGRCPCRSMAWGDHQISPTQPMPRCDKADLTYPQQSNTSEIATAKRLGWFCVMVECFAKQSLSTNVSVAHHLTPETDSHPTAVKTERVVRQAFLQCNIFLTICNEMARSQQSFGKREQLEEWHLQAAAHFHDFAKARILQEAEFVRKGSLCTFTQTNATGEAPYEGPSVLLWEAVALVTENTTRLAAQLSAQRSTKEKSRDKVSGVPDINFHCRSWNKAARALHSKRVSSGITAIAAPN